MIEHIYSHDAKVFARCSNGLADTSYIEKLSPLYLAIDEQGYKVFDIFDNREKHVREVSNCKKRKIYSSASDHLFYKNKDNINENPLVMYLDIETDVNSSFPNPRYARERINLIQVSFNDMSEKIILGLKQCPKLNEVIKNENPDIKVFYKVYDSEQAMLNAFLDIISDRKPLLVYAWNGDGFDFPFIYKRIQKNGLDTNRLSPFYDYYKLHNISTSELVKLEEVPGPLMKFAVQSKDIFYLDIKDIFQKIYLERLQSYSLDSVCETILGINKVTHTEFKTFTDFYNGNYVKPVNPTDSEKSKYLYKICDDLSSDEIKQFGYAYYVYYGAIDVHLMKLLDDTIGITSYLIFSAKTFGCTIKKCLGTTAKWSILLKYKMLEQGFISSEKLEDKYSQVPLIGGYVRNNLKGLKKYVVSFDVNSMYPNIMRAFNIAPETYVDDTFIPDDILNLASELRQSSDESNDFEIFNERFDDLRHYAKSHNLSVSPLGYFFSDKPGVMPMLVGEIFNERKLIKEKLKNETDKDLIRRLSVQQMTKKIQINSLYGATGNQYFYFFNPGIAASITSIGRVLIKEVANKFNEKMTKMIGQNYDFIVYGDTDSLYIDFSPIIHFIVANKFNVSDEEKISQLADKHYYKIIEQMTGYVYDIINDIVKDIFNALGGNSEYINFERENILYRCNFIAKKKYVGLIESPSGYKLKAMGVEIAQGGLSNKSKEILRNLTIIGLKNPTSSMFRNELEKVKDEYLKYDIANACAVKQVNCLKHNSKYGDAGPAGLKASLEYNHLIKTPKFLDYNFSEIINGTRCYVVYLKRSYNGYSNVIYIPVNLDNLNVFESLIDKYIDKNRNFNTVILEPIKRIINFIDTTNKFSFDNW